MVVNGKIQILFLKISYVSNNRKQKTFSLKLIQIKTYAILIFIFH